MTTANNKNNNNKTTKSITKTAQKMIRMNLVAVEQAASCKKLYKKQRNNNDEYLVPGTLARSTRLGRATYGQPDDLRVTIISTFRALIVDYGSYGVVPCIGPT